MNYPQIFEHVAHSICSPFGVCSYVSFGCPFLHASTPKHTSPNIGIRLEQVIEWRHAYPTLCYCHLVVCAQFLSL